MRVEPPGRTARRLKNAAPRRHPATHFPGWSGRERLANRVVLTDDVVRRLAEAATRIKQVFHGKEQDIEWAVMRGQIYIVQSRPFIAGG